MRAIGKPVALDASADDRDTRGFISMTTISPFSGFTANWMLQPPAATPISRMIAHAASRIVWYSRSVSVIAGATVIESPVCTPIGSRFSIEQTITTLSAESRITSSSNSFQPISERSMSTCLVGERSSPRRTIASYSSRLYAMPPPEPPSVNDGRMMAGKPVHSEISSASSQVVANLPAGVCSPSRRIAYSNSFRSSAMRIDRASAPISSVLYFSSTPRSASAIATLSAVWPPIVGRIASGRSRSMMRSTYSGVTGSMYVRSANSGSVMIVAGFEFTSTTSYPSSRSAFTACVPE